MTRAERQQRAAERAMLRAIRSDAQQLALLRERGHGNCNEARRLVANIIKGENANA